MYTKINKCRICGNQNLIPIIDLGNQVLTGVFPKSQEELITNGPLRLVKCHDENNSVCGLLQLEHSYESNEMYGENYGYRSGLNSSMVQHLNGKISKIKNFLALNKGDLIIDIGSNDGTTLRAYEDQGYDLVGIDPTGNKFKEYYPPWISLVPDFFSAKLIKDKYPSRKAKVITSFSMFYDLNDPTGFMKEIKEILAPDGIWVFEQSYMPSMLEMCSYDTICHEHLEYYALHQIQWMAELVGLRIIDVSLNDTNGGSFSIACVNAAESSLLPSASVQRLLDEEVHSKLNTLEPYLKFAARTVRSREELKSFIANIKSKGHTINALGASTKGNVILQYCNLTPQDINLIGEVNPEKFSRFSPGSLIPIISETDLLANHNDYLLILPWHFRKFFLENPKFNKFKLVFPIPAIEVIEPR
jgi:NDP-4-keto-2,6-dideoxyhexose 3-C-methyltransferase